MANNRKPIPKGGPLPLTELKVGNYYEDILTEQRVLIAHAALDASVDRIICMGRYYNKVTGLFTDFEVADNQLREFTTK